LINPETNDFYAPITRNSLTCKLNGKEVNKFNATILVNEDNGRSIVAANKYFISPDERIYNFLSYPEITSLSVNASGEAGGNYVKINGLYFYSEDYLQAEIGLAVRFVKTIQENVFLYLLYWSKMYRNALHFDLFRA
jgi:hypothetical protein